MSKSLRISREISLPLDIVTKTVAILAQRRKGKTYTASVIAEEMVAAGVPFVALDPTGAWWGLRSSSNGIDAGLPVVVLGGQHGDIPLDRTAGRAVADLVVDEPGWYVIDFSLFESGAAERQFATDFAERLYRRKGQPDSDFPLHLFVDEADRFVPQRAGGGRGEARETDARMLGAFEAIVRRGGLGFRIVIAQRVRLYGIDTPERGQPRYDMAKMKLQEFVIARRLIIRSVKPHDKYGRWLAQIQVPGMWPDVAEELIALGLGKRYDGGAKT